jgi:hypothetical protein
MLHLLFPRTPLQRTAGLRNILDSPTKSLHVAVRKYLAQIEALKKPNTHRKYEAVIERFIEFFRDKESMDQIGAADLTRYIIALKKYHNLGANTVLHNAIIVAQFFKRQGRGGITRGLQLPERIIPLPREYRTADLSKFFKAAYDSEKALFISIDGFALGQCQHQARAKDIACRQSSRLRPAGQLFVDFMPVDSIARPSQQFGQFTVSQTAECTEIGRLTKVISA